MWGFYLLAEFVDVDTFGGGMCAYLREGDVLVSTGCGRALDRRFAAFCASGASNCGTAAVTQPGRIDCGANSGNNAAMPSASELRTLMLQ